MQPRFASLLFASVLLGLSLAAIPARAGEFQRFPAQSAPPASDESQIKELKELLRQAQRLQEAQQAALEKAKSVGRGAQASPPAKAADGEKPAEGGSQKAEGEDGADKREKKEEPKDVARPGCMYRGTTLIWEKVPGTCKK